MSVRRIIVTTCENAHFLFILLERTVISKLPNILIWSNQVSL